MARKQLRGLYGRRVMVEVGANCTIHPTARFGTEVRLGRDVTIGPEATIGRNSHLNDGSKVRAHAVIGEFVYMHQSVVGVRSTVDNHCQLYNMKLGTYVMIGRRAQCYDASLERGVTFGHGLVIHGSRNMRLRHVVGGHYVRLAGAMALEGSVQLPIHIGTSTELAQHWGVEEVMRVKGHVIFGPHCRITACDITGPATIGEKVRLSDMQIGGNVKIGDTTTASGGHIGSDVEIGAGVVVRHGTDIPTYWWVPDDMILNPNPNGAPVVIKRPPRPRED